MAHLLMVQGVSWKGLRDPNPIHHRRDLASSRQVWLVLEL